MRRLHTGAFMPLPLVGTLALDVSGKLQVNGIDYQYKKMFTIYAELFVIIDTQQGLRWCVWRDSVREDAYRHLLALFR